MVKWNLMRLADALDPFVELKTSTGFVEENFDNLFSSYYLGTLGKKLGFIT